MILIKEIGLGYVSPSSKYQCQLGVYQCPECLDYFTLSTYKVTYYKQKYCRPCYHKLITTHKGSKTLLYKVWASMLNRCSNEKHKAFPSYGGRGITVVDSWKDFKIFSQWAYENGYEDKLSIDRIDNNLGYFPNNCRWTTNKVQGRNTRINQNNTSGYRGVSFHKNRGTWQAAIRVHPKRVYLGQHSTAEKAALAVNKYIIDNNLEHTLNIIPDKQPHEID
jgi:hypothetical protein